MPVPPNWLDFVVSYDETRLSFVGTTMLSLHAGSPFIVTASNWELSVHLADFRFMRRRPGNPSWLPPEHVLTSVRLSLRTHSCSLILGALS